ILMLISLHMFVVSGDISAKMSSSMMDSILLINLSDLGTMTEQPSQSKRRAAVTETDLSDQLEEGENGESPQNPPTLLDSTPFSSFEATHEAPLETNPDLTLAFKNAFSSNEDIPSYEDFKGSIENLASKKDGFGLSNRSFLSATKSLILAFYQAGGEFNQESNLPLALYYAILPKIEQWGGGVSNWVKSLAKISMEATLESDLSIPELSVISSSFAGATVELISGRSIPDGTEGENAESSPIIPDLNFDYLEVNDNLILEDKINLGQNYSPTKTDVLQQLSVGLSQGYFGYYDFKDGLTKDDFNRFANPDSSPNPTNDGQIEANIVTGFFDGLMDAAVELGETKEVFMYDSIKASANGFLISATVASTSKAEYLDQFLYLDAAEMISKQVSQSVILHSTENEAQPNPVVSYSMGLDWIETDRIAESASAGAAMGSQLATVLPKSLDYTDSWEIATNIRRDIAKSVSRGSSSGALNSASWLGSVASDEGDEKTVLSGNDIEKVARGTSLGSMIGNTGLAIYYPTDQLVPIINLTAQGSAYGSTNSNNLALVQSDSIETIDIGVARQSALGSAMGAIFEPTVLLGLNPAQSSNEKDTIDHLTAASFGATFGAILGLQDNETEIISSKGSSQFDESRVVEVQQATKQGAIEGALAGAKLSLSLDEVNSDTLKSKTVMLKAVNSANTKAAANSTSNVANQSLRTNSQDMLLLMKKFGINPRYTNPAKMYKRPVIVQVDEPPIDDESSEAINNASPL
ncbi:MAG: hypothetical protein O2874_08515, partial [Verrucomicrobia bacterium]|nr:hypothetical protein [Verrucomicrobiota bacterium]